MAKAENAKELVVRDPAPNGLTAKSAQFWYEMIETFDFAPHERMILEQVCRELDLIAKMETAQRASSVIIDGQYGVPTSAPMLAEVARHRSLVARLTAALKLPADAGLGSGEAVQPTSLADAGRKMVAARWAKAGRGAAAGGA